MQPDDRLTTRKTTAPSSPQRIYKKPEVTVIGRLADVTGGDDCGTLDFPIGNSGFGCATS